MSVIVIRTILIYFLLIFAMRLSGKRQLGEIQLSELITTFLLSEIASYPLTDPGIPFLHAAIPVLTIISLEIILSFSATKSALMKKILDGKPSIIIREGVLDQKEMLKMRLNLEDLLCELRLKNIAAIEDVAYAILEQNGQISVFPKESKREITLGDLHLLPHKDGIAHAVIVDGHIVKENLDNAQKTEKWLRHELKKRRIDDIRRVFLMTVNDNGAVYLIPKQDGKGHDG